LLPGLAEATGSFVLVLVGAGAACIDRTTAGAIGRLGLALTSGFTLGVMIFALRGFHQAYFNPAITVAAVLTRRMTPRAAVVQLLSQMSGAAAAGVLLRLVFPDALGRCGLGAPMLAYDLGFGRGIFIEAFVGFAWVFAFAATLWRKPPTELGPVAVGLAYAAGIMFAAPLTGGAGNPMRAFGPAFASGVYTSHAVYWLGPLLGGLVAGALAPLFLRPPAATPEPRPLSPRRVREQPAAEAEAAAEPAPTPPVDEAMACYNRGLALFKEGQLELAAQELARATEIRPSWPEPYYYIGMVYREYGDLTNANAFFDAALYFRGAHVEAGLAGRKAG
jgi:glycerol uptake facilitator-like aquaporin